MEELRNARGRFAGVEAGPSRPSEPLDSDPRIEDYLDRVLAPLIGRVEYARRKEIREEMSDHLFALVEARQSLGEELDTAVDEAIRQFGSSEKHARFWCRELARRQRNRSDKLVLPAALTAVALFGSAVLYLYLVVAKTPSGDPGVAALLAAPIILGLLTGLLSRGRQAMGAFAGIVILILIMMVVATTTDPNELPNIVSQTLILLFFLWLPLGCVSAGMGGWLRQIIELKSGGIGIV